MQLVNKRNVIIAGSIVVLLVVIGGLFAAQQSRNNANDTAGEPRDIETVDQNSGETISTIEDKSPENFGMLPDTPTFLNLDEFITNGLSMEQLNSLRYAFYTYTTSTNPKIKQVSITKDSVIAAPPNADGKVVATFEVMFDAQPKMPGKLVYFGESIELTITDASGKKVFESGTVTNKSVFLDQPE